MFSEELDGQVLFLRRRGIVGVDQHVRVKEGEFVHRRSCSSSRLNFHPRELPWVLRESRSNSTALALGSVLPANCSKYARTSWFTLVPSASARRLASWMTSSSTDSVTFIFPYYVRTYYVSIRQ